MGQHSEKEPAMTRHSEITAVTSGPTVYRTNRKDGITYEAEDYKAGVAGDVMKVDGALFRLATANGRGCEDCAFYCAGDKHAAAMNYGVPCGLRRYWRIRMCNPVGEHAEERTIFEALQGQLEL